MYKSFLFVILACCFACTSNGNQSNKIDTSAAIETSQEIESAKEIVESAAEDVLETEEPPSSEELKTEGVEKIAEQAVKRPVDRGSEKMDEKRSEEPAKSEKSSRGTAIVELKEETKEKPKTEAKEKPITVIGKAADPPAEKKEVKQVLSTGKPDKPIEEKPKPANSLSHDVWNVLLNKYVSSIGKVNYSAFKAEEGKLDEYLNILEDNPVSESWSRDKKLAYWINAYNAYTVKLILKNYPVKSITDLHAGKPWDVKWINLSDKKLSLNNIENDIIRPEFGEPRIHFAVNCAAKSCPPLLNKAWTSSNLESNFEKQSKEFINNPAYNSVSENEAKVSKIFEWYKKDFGDLKAFINKYSDIKLAPKAKIKFMEYDWTLNN